LAQAQIACCKHCCPCTRLSLLASAQRLRLFLVAWAVDFDCRMGARLTYLEQPVTEKELLDGGLSHDSTFIRYGNCGMQGWRRNMEDAHLAAPDFHDGVGLFGVFDGHGGRGVSRFAAKELPRLIKDTDGWKTGDYQQALEQAFLRLDESLLETSGRRQVQELDRLEPGEPRRPLVVPRKAIQRMVARTPAKAPQASPPSNDRNGGSCASGQGRDRPSQNKSDDNDSEDRRLFGDDEQGKEQHGEAQEVHSSAVTPAQAPSASDGSEEPASTSEAEAEAEKENAKPSPQGKGAHDAGEAVAPDSDNSSRAQEEPETEEDEEEDDEPDENELVALDINSLKGESTPERQGCTAVVVMVVHSTNGDQKRQVFCANAGDSRAVLSRLGGAVALSEDHKPENPGETARIKKAGGWVEDMQGGARVNGDLNLSRALGDFRYKTNNILPAAEQVVTAFPEVRTMELKAEDEFIVIGCDGIWEKHGNQDLVDFIRTRLAVDPSARADSKEFLPQLSKICAEICDQGLCPSMELDKNPGFDGRGCDNMTAMVVQLKKRIEALANSAKRLAASAELGCTAAAAEVVVPARKRAKMDVGEGLEQKQLTQGAGGQ